MTTPPEVQAEQPSIEGLAPIPTNVALIQATGADGKKWLAYQFITAVGSNTFWFDEQAVPGFIGMQQQALIALKSGLVLPANSPLIVPSGG